VYLTENVFLTIQKVSTYFVSMFKRHHLFVPNKRDYIKGNKKPKVGCIICAILAKDPRVENLLVWKDDLWAASVNLYPYNPGHIFLFPVRHIIDLRDLTQEEAQRMFLLTNHCLTILDSLFEPCGYNVGFNIGDASGASIDHLHQHMVPRYPKELGFVDICAGAKIIIEDPLVTVEKLKKAFRERPLKK